MKVSRREHDEFARKLLQIQNGFRDAEHQLDEVQSELLKISRRLSDMEANLRANLDALRERFEC